MVLTGTITAIGVLSGGLWALCASVFATAGWTAPACLAAGVSSTVGLILGIVKDVKESKASGGKNPEKRNLDQDIVTYFKVHHDGSYEDYSERLHELYGTNETHTMVDMTRGYTHTMRMVDNYVQVHTDFTKPGIATAPRPFFQKEYHLGLSRRLTPAEQKNEYQHLELMALKESSNTYSPTQADQNSVGRDIADGAYKLGTWCADIRNGGTILAGVGTTLGGNGYSPGYKSPCES